MIDVAAHDEGPDQGDGSGPRRAIGAVVADLGTMPGTGAGGAVWSLPHGGDLDANFVRLDAGRGIAMHVNDEVDVLIFVQSGTGEIDIDGDVHRLRSDVLVLVPRGSSREVKAGRNGIYYLSVHRRRDPLTITMRR